MVHKRGSERGVIQVASGLMLAAFGAMFALAGCSSTPQEGENLGSVSQAVVCGGVTCGTGANDCNTYSCSLALTCVVGKPIKNPGDACTAPGKLVNPPGRCATSADGKYRAKIVEHSTWYVLFLGPAEGSCVGALSADHPEYETQSTTASQFRGAAVNGMCNGYKVQRNLQLRRKTVESGAE